MCATCSTHFIYPTAVLNNVTRCTLFIIT